MKRLLLPLLLLFAFVATAQSKVGGSVIDENNDPVAFANILFKNSYEVRFRMMDGGRWMTDDG